MTCEFICDGCGKHEKGIKSGYGYTKPRDWFQRSDNDGVQDACSRECIKIIAQKTGKTSIAIPI